MITKIKSKLIPIEIAIISVIVCCYVIYAFLGIKLRDPWLLYWQRIPSILYMYFFMLVVVFFLQRLKDIKSWRRTKKKIIWQATWDNFKKDYLTINNIAIDIRILNAVAILFVMIINLRHIVPYVNQGLYDGYLVSLEEFLFAGKLPSVWMINIFGSSSALMMNDIYRLFYPYLSIIIFTFVLSRDRLFSQQFFISFVIIWMVGIVVTCIFPTWGPCFFRPQLFATLPETTMTQMQQGLWQMKQHLELNPLSTNGAYLISAMPSLHVCVVALGSIYLIKMSRILCFLSWIFTVLTIVSTLYFGWHYLFDDLAAIAIAYLAFWISRSVFSGNSHAAG